MQQQRGRVSVKGRKAAISKQMLVARIEKQLGAIHGCHECASSVEVAIADEDRIEFHRMDLDGHVRRPRRPEVGQRHARMKQQRTTSARACLCQLLRRHHAHREAGVDNGGAQLPGGANATLDDLRKAELFGVRDAVLEAVELTPIEKVRCTDSMTFAPDVVGKGVNTRRQAVRMMKQENVCHSSVTAV